MSLGHCQTQLVQTEISSQRILLCCFWGRWLACLLACPRIVIVAECLLKWSCYSFTPVYTFFHPLCLVFIRVDGWIVKQGIDHHLLREHHSKYICWYIFIVKCMVTFDLSYIYLSELIMLIRVSVQISCHLNVNHTSQWLMMVNVSAYFLLYVRKSHITVNHVGNYISTVFSRVYENHTSQWITWLYACTGGTGVQSH